MKRDIVKLHMHTAVFAAALCLLAACSGKEEGPSGPAGVLIEAPAGPVVAQVGGEAITMPMLDVFARGRGMDPQDPAQRQQALDALIETVLLAQDARASGMLDRPEVQAEVALARLLQMSGRRIAAFRESVQVDEPELRAYYQQEVQRAGDEEYHLKHILFADEDAALAAAGEALRGQADFDALMAEYAAKGAQQARDLGWANRTQLPPELADAARQLADGQTAPVPVRTSFGWHVLHRVAARPFEAPPYEQVREGARRQLVERAVADKVRALRSQADIVLPGSDASSAPPAAPQPQPQG